ncbi:MAG TPA: hypothetical protein VHO70_22840 [Chitinispirillaceae bacterium]|nr:hypothetical protein [Chitinispirillaceae bacterium]
MNRIASIVLSGAVLLVTSIFAVEWQKESDAFEFPVASVRHFRSVSKDVYLSGGKICGKNMMQFKYALPSDVVGELEVYSISGVRLAALPIAKKSSSVIWKTTTKHASGTYTAVLKTADFQKSVRFVIAN